MGGGYRGGVRAVGSTATVLVLVNLCKAQEAARPMFFGTGSGRAADLIERGGRGRAKEGGATPTFGTVIRGVTRCVLARAFD